MRPAVLKPFLQGYFYPRPPRGGRLLRRGKRRNVLVISIHALREEGDAARLELCGTTTISIHALREEGDTLRRAAGHDRRQFLSTPSARRATFFNRTIFRFRSRISIHALREEGDLRPTRR